MNGEEWYIDTTDKKMLRAYDGGHFQRALPYSACATKRDSLIVKEG